MLHDLNRLFCLGALVCAISGALAQQEPVCVVATASPPFAYGLQAADDADLDSLRGGFEMPSGLAVSFGVVRSVTVNGELVSQNRFFLPDLANISASDAKLASDALGQVTLVQNGVGNSVALPIQGNNLLASTVVQNSLNNQTIQTLTEINAGANSLGILRSINTQGALRDALIGAVGAR